jgi:hypothetical protein
MSLQLSDEPDGAGLIGQRRSCKMKSTSIQAELPSGSAAIAGNVFLTVLKLA